MQDSVCIVEVGVHPKPYWMDKNQDGFVVCNRHKHQYEERVGEFGPFDWEEVKED